MSTRQGNDVFKDDRPEGAAGWTGPSTNVMRDEFGLDIPVESIPLPSKGIVYPPDSPLFGKETIDIRPMTAREEDILTSRALIKKGTVITELIKSCLIDKRINPEDLLVGDRNAVMTSLRITGYGSEYNVEVTCPSCGEKSKQSFDLSELPIKRLSHDPIAQGSNCFECKIPTGTEGKDLIVRYRFLTGEDEREIQLMQERNKKSGMTADQLITTRYKYQVIGVNDVTDKNKIMMFVQKMPTKYSRALRKHMDENEPGVEMKSHMNCPHCFEESEVSMPIGASFFWPDAE